jgi:site-specific recombinase XerD
MCTALLKRRARMSTWDGMLPQYEAHLRQSDLAQNTVTGYVRDVCAFARWLAERLGEHVSPRAFTSGDVEAYKQHLEDALGRAPASINRSLQSLRTFGRFAVAAGIRESNPAQSVGLLKVPAVPSCRSLEAREIERLLGSVESGPQRTAARDCAIIQLLLQTGIRVGELVELQLTDIDLGENPGALRIRSQGKRPERRLPLNEAVRRSLRTYLDQPRTGEAVHVFLSRAGKPLSIRSVQHIVASAGKAVGLEISGRTLRDTYAAHLWQDTGDLTLLSQRLGHRRPEAALKYISPLTATGSTTEVL